MAKNGLVLQVLCEVAYLLPGAVLCVQLNCISRLPGRVKMFLQRHLWMAI